MIPEARAVVQLSTDHVCKVCASRHRRRGPVTATITVSPAGAVTELSIGETSAFAVWLAAIARRDTSFPASRTGGTLSLKLALP
jgi:hypothetical protein